MRGTKIIVSANPQGKFIEGVVSGTPKPGTMMEISSFTLVGGRFTWRAFQPGTDGQRRLVAILLEDDKNGGIYSDAYASGERIEMYCPLPGEEMNILMADVAGTGDDHTAGETVICKSGTGKFIATTGTPQSEPFRLLESATDPTADFLAWAMATGQ